MDHKVKNIDELRQVVDALETAYKEAMATTTDVELSKAKHKVGVAFRGLQYNVYVLAQIYERELTSHQVDINYGRVQPESAELAVGHDTTNNKDMVDVAEAVDAPVKDVKPKRKGRSKKEA